MQIDTETELRKWMSDIFSYGWGGVGIYLQIFEGVPSIWAQTRVGWFSTSSAITITRWIFNVELERESLSCYQLNIVFQPIVISQDAEEEVENHPTLVWAQIEGTPSNFAFKFNVLKVVISPLSSENRVIAWDISSQYSRITDRWQTTCHDNSRTLQCKLQS